ncbi:MAG: L7Ae/L30e/S12e/Gadd45 family ribosomal protein [Evtepia gabavorous]
MDSIPSLLGLALRAGRLAVGEEPVGVACRCHKGYLLLLASDAADNTIRRALHFCQAGITICLTLPDQTGAGQRAGRASCAMLALTDVGFAAAVAEKLAQLDPEAYGPAWETLSNKAARSRNAARKALPHKNKGARRAKRKPDCPSNGAAKGMDKRRSHTL